MKSMIVAMAGVCLVLGLISAAMADEPASRVGCGDLSGRYLLDDVAKRCTGVSESSQNYLSIVPGVNIGKSKEISPIWVTGGSVLEIKQLSCDEIEITGTRLARTFTERVTLVMGKPFQWESERNAISIADWTTEAKGTANVPAPMVARYYWSLERTPDGSLKLKDGVTKGGVIIFAFLPIPAGGNWEVSCTFPPAP